MASLPCSNCNSQDETIVPHHLKGRYSPYSGGTGYKASDWLAMPLCYRCHTKVHSGDIDLMDFQIMLILKTLDKAFRDGIIIHGKHRLFGEDLYD